MAFLEMRPYIWIPSASKIYGAEWLGTSDPAWTRTDDAAGLSDPNPAVNNGNGNSPFDTIYPWKDMKRVENSTAGTLVEIPKFYYKWIRSGTKMKLLITDNPSDGFFVSPAHADRGDGKGERNVVYVGAYHCASDYKSKTGVLPLSNKTRAEFRTGIHNLASDIWQNDFALYWTIRMLYLIEYAHWNSQLKIGYGCSNSGTASENSGLCDSMAYHTGTNTVNRTTYGHTRYRYIEDLWGNIYDWCDGIYILSSSNSAYCIKNPAYFSDTSNGTFIGAQSLSNVYKLVTSWTNYTITGFEYALFPNAVGNNSTYSAYICDRLGADSDGSAVAVGGNYSQDQAVGMFQMYVRIAASTKSAAFGSRLMKLP